MWKEQVELSLLEDKKNKEAAFTDARRREATEKNPKMKAIKVQCSQIERKIRNKRYTQEELSTQSVEQLNKMYTLKRKELLKLFDTTMFELDKEFGASCSRWQALAQEQNELYYKSWYTTHKKEFEEYSHLLYLKLRAEAELELLKRKKASKGSVVSKSVHKHNSTHTDTSASVHKCGEGCSHNH